MSSNTRIRQRHWDWIKEPVKVVETNGVTVQDDFCLKFYDYDSLGSDILLGSAWVNTAMLVGSGLNHVTITRAELDKPDKRLGPGFVIQVLFEYNEREAKEAGALIPEIGDDEHEVYLLLSLIIILC